MEIHFKGIPETVLNEWNDLWRKVLQLHGHWKLYIDLYGEEKHLKLMHDTLPDVFGLLQKALRHEIVMAHGRLLDPPRNRHQDNMSLSRLVASIRPHCPPAFHTQLEGMLKDAKTHCAKIIKWRDKQAAHNDFKISFGIDEEKLPDIEREEIEKGLRMLADLLNEIDLHFNDRTTPFEHVLMDGTGGDLMSYIQRALDADAENFKRKSGIYMPPT
jgi:hypothetical protein